jgi:hypothetical protein
VAGAHSSVLSSLIDVLLSHAAVGVDHVIAPQSFKSPTRSPSKLLQVQLDRGYARQRKA